MQKGLILLFVALWLALVSCAINPVTGKRQLALLPQSYEIEMGQKQYAPIRQMHGGDYLLDPELTEYVQSIGQRLAAVSDRKLPFEFVVLNNSIPNAWALPGGKIAINRGLLVELQSEAELAAVIGHEIVHAAARHGAQSFERGLLLQGAFLAVAIATGGNDFSSLAVGAAAVGGDLIKQRYSREAELEADHYGIVYMIRAGYDPQAAVDLQETFVRLSESKQPNWLAGLFASHPPSPERVQKNRDTVTQLAPENGEEGRSRYQEKTSHLRKAQPAYEAYDKARQALNEGDLKTARSFVETALRIEPDEGRFDCLLGDIMVKWKDYHKAMKAYQTAIAKEPDYFRNYYQRGKLWIEMGNQKEARKDLEKSLVLLPTADCHYALGMLNMDQGDHREAVKSFKAAAKSKSQAGKAALHALHRLDLSDHPDRYLKSRVERKKGRLRIIIHNPTTVSVRNLRLKVKRSSKRSFKLSVNRTIKPGGHLKIQTDVEEPKKKNIYKWNIYIEEAIVVD
ncbi:MAG: M48 family metalloprotease [Desulfobacterales bacterium]